MGENIGMDLTSKAFDNGGSIPPKYTCDAENVSPPLACRGAPDKTKSFALVVHDPDAPNGDWVHWVIYHLPASHTELSENIPANETLSNGGMQGRNDFKKIGYGGPCPPSGTHHYHFQLYALDSTLPLHAGATRQELEKAMHGHVVAEALLIGTYQRRK